MMSDKAKIILLSVATVTAVVSAIIFGTGAQFGHFSHTEVYVIINVQVPGEIERP
jgi:hypothetical protein